VFVGGKGVVTQRVPLTRVAAKQGEKELPDPVKETVTEGGEKVCGKKTSKRAGTGSCGMSKRVRLNVREGEKSPSKTVAQTVTLSP